MDRFKFRIVVALSCIFALCQESNQIKDNNNFLRYPCKTPDNPIFSSWNCLDVEDPLVNNKLLRLLRDTKTIKPFKVSELVITAGGKKIQGEDYDVRFRHIRLGQCEIVIDANNNKEGSNYNTCTPI